MNTEIINKVNNGKRKFVTAVTCVSACMATSVFAFAEDVGTTAAMTTAMTAIKTDVMGVMAVVAPIGIGIAGAFMVWRLGFKFFKSLTGK